MKIGFLMLATVLAFGVKADNGWELIKHNNLVEAQTEFQKRFEKDTTDVEAIKGLMVLADFRQDYLAYDSLVYRLMYNEKDLDYLAAFKDDIVEERMPFIKEEGVPFEFYYEQFVNEVNELKRKRNFKDARAKELTVFNRFKWSMIGPFKNVSGSGFEHAYGPEKESFDPNKSYDSQLGKDWKWIYPDAQSFKGEVNFDEYLSETEGGGVYYANTYFDLDQDQEVYIRIGRAEPLKVWVDDCLVFAGKDPIKWDYDQESVALNLKKGTHRILIKVAPFSSIDDSEPFLNFNSNKCNVFAQSSYGGFFSFMSSVDTDILLRMTDKNGKKVGKANDNQMAEYTPQEYQAKELDYYALASVKSKIASNPDDWFNYYLYNQIAFNRGHSKYIEQDFTNYQEGNEDAIFFRFLLARILGNNGKMERAYALLTDIDHTKTPIYGLLHEKFEEKDLKVDEDGYMALLEQLEAITPTSYRVIKARIKYYEHKGMEDEKETFIKAKMEEIPDYKFQLESILNEDNKPYKERLEKEEKKEEKEQLKRLKKEFDIYDHQDAISYYKKKGKFAKVVELYDELIQYYPYYTNYYEEKANFLYSEEKYEDALAEVDKALRLRPYDADLYELHGDIQNDMENKDAALKDYKTAMKYFVGGGYGFNSIKEKVDKIEGAFSLSGKFNDLSFDEILADRSWRMKYGREDAVVLSCIRDVYLDETDIARMQTKYMVQILTETGVKDWTETDFGFMGNLSSVKVIKQNGSEIVPDRSGTYVVFKGLEPGDIIQAEGDYDWYTRSEFGKGIYLPTYFTYVAPIHYAKLEILSHNSNPIHFKLFKMKDTKKVTEEGDFTRYQFEYNDIRKFENEDAVRDVYDYYSSIAFSTFPDWATFVQWYQDKTYRKFELNYELKEILAGLVNDDMTDQEKIEVIYNYITKEVNYSFVSFLQSGYVPKNTDLTCSAGIGDCKDVATLMISMLREIGIESYYTLVKTNSMNHQDMLPSLSFDHVIVAYVIDGETKYLDLTTDFYPYYVLTGNDIDAWGLLIKDGVNEVFKLPNDALSKEKNTIKYNVDATVEKDRSLTLKIDAVYPGVSGGQLREYTNRVGEDEEKVFVLNSFVGNTYENLDLVGYEYVNAEDISTPLKAEFEFKAPRYSDIIADLYILNIPHASEISSSPVFSRDVRFNPLDLSEVFSIEPVEETIVIHFPKGYKMVKVPEDKVVDDAFGYYSLHFKPIKGGVEITKKRSFNQDVIFPDQFSAFRDFYFRIQELDRTKLALINR